LSIAFESHILMVTDEKQETFHIHYLEVETLDYELVVMPELI